jgi:hypothetical protein
MISSDRDAAADLSRRINNNRIYVIEVDGEDVKAAVSSVERGADLNATDWALIAKALESYAGLRSNE